MEVCQCMYVCMYVFMKADLPYEGESGFCEVFRRNRHGHGVDDGLSQSLHIQLGRVVLVLVILHTYVLIVVVCMYVCICGSTNLV